MFITEDDIQFEKLTDRKFEELCFDLLWKLGYQSLVWRRGSADSGRDIEARYPLINPLVSSYDEKWFFECKRYALGVPVNKISSKIAWADAEKPKHFVIITSSYISNSARNWLEKIAAAKLYKIHIIEGKQLKKILLRFSDIVSDYFLDKYSKLLLQAKKNWLIHDLLSEAETLSVFAKKIDPSKLFEDDLAFLWCTIQFRSNEISEWCLDNDPISFDFLFSHICNFSNTSKQVISDNDDIEVISLSTGFHDFELAYQKYVAARLIINSSTKPILALYSLVRDTEGEGVEVLIEATGNFTTKIRHIASRAGEEVTKALKILESH